jgi:hypothetical protein
LKSDLASIQIKSAADFLSYMLFGPAAIRLYLAANPSSELNTDDNAYLEYHTPFEWLESNKVRVDQILQGLLPYAGLDVDVTQDLSVEDHTRVVDLWAKRKDQILPEMNAPWN